MDQPSDDLLSAFAGVLRRVERTELVLMLERFHALDEHPTAIAAIESEIQSRSSPKVWVAPQST